MINSQSSNKFIRSVSILAGGTAFGQLIVMAASPILTRLYSPEDFGLLAVYAGILGIIGVIASLCYEFAVPLASDDKEAASIVVLCASIVFVISLITTIPVRLWPNGISTFLNAPGLVEYLWLLPMGILFLGLYQILNYWAIRYKLFSPIAKTRFTQSFGMVVVQVGAYPLGPLALLIGHVLGQGAGIASLVSFTIRPRWNIFRQVRARDLFEVAKRWRKFPFYSSWSGLFNTASIQIPTILFAVFFSPAAAGIYMLTQRVLDIPMRVVGQAISNVFIVSAKEALREGKLTDLVADVHKNLAHLAMPPTLILILGGPDLFDMVFGPEWHQAGEFAQWMAVWIYMAFITSPLSQLFFVLERQVLCMLLQGLLLVTRIGCLAAGAISGNLMFTISLLSVGSALCYIGFLIWIVYASGNSLRTFIVTNLEALLIAGILVSPMILLNFIDNQSYDWKIALSVTMTLIIARYVSLIRRSW